MIGEFCTVSRSELIKRLRQAEKDAARYRWLMQNARLGIGRNGKDWDLQVDGPAPDAISDVSAWIDNHTDLMDGKAKCQNCGSQFDDFTEEAEFIGWHGVCVKCFLSEESNA